MSEWFNEERMRASSRWMIFKWKHCSGEHVKKIPASSIAQKCQMYYPLSNHEGGIRQVVTLMGTTCQPGLFTQKSKSKNTSNIQVDNGKASTQQGRLKTISRKATPPQQVKCNTGQRQAGCKVGILGCVQQRGRLSEQSTQAEMRAQVQAGDGPREAMC